jgi:hypothetical protein
MNYELYHLLGDVIPMTDGLRSSSIVLQANLLVKYTSSLWESQRHSLACASGTLYGLGT